MAYQFNGTVGTFRSGFAVSSAGDVTGDGLVDLIIGAPFAHSNRNGEDAGEIFLVSGADLIALDNATANGGTAGDGVIELADVAAIGTSYQFNGADANDLAGYSVSSAGDVTGDGIDDLIIGVPRADPNGVTMAGESYLISGADLAALDNATANGGTAGDGIIELANVAAIGHSYQFNGIDANDNSGVSVSSAGDVTGDGIDDLIIGAYQAGPNGVYRAGESYLISGADLAALDNATANGGTVGDGVIELADVAAIGTSYQFTGADPHDLAGYSVSSAGDVTGDGIDDLMIGASELTQVGGTYSAKSYLISGADLAALDNAIGNGGTAGDGIIELADVAAIGTSYQFNATGAEYTSRLFVSFAGDVTGDGINDLLIGSPANGVFGSGESYLISGADLIALDNATANGGTAGDGIIELADVAAIGTSYQFNGIDRADRAGSSVSYAGDVTGDGIDDLIIGAHDASTGTQFSDYLAGETYLISGADLIALDNATANGGTAGDGIIELADVAAIGTSYQFNGSDQGDQSGMSISYAGDMTGDGVDDLLIGASFAAPHGNQNEGETYLVSGADLATYDARDGIVDGVIDLSLIALLCTGVATDGNDTIIGSNINECIAGGNGDDHLSGVGGNDTIVGGAGNDTLLGGANEDSLEGNSGDDSLLGEQGHDTLFGGDGADTLEGGIHNDQLYGGNDDDVLNGDGGVDQLFGENGNDILEGGMGNDGLFGGSGNDTLFGGRNEDRLEGGANEDHLFGEAGHDTLHGGNGHDTLDGGWHNDWLYGGNGNDLLDGGGGVDRLFGQNGNDILLGGNGNDILRGGDGTDTIRGGTNEDLIEGGGDDDQLFGDAGHDTLDGGIGNDTLSGGWHNDTFVFANGFGQDVITDFDPNNANEIIDLSAVTEITDLTDLIDNHMTQVGADVVIADGSNSITIQGVTLAEMSDGDDFLF